MKNKKSYDNPVLEVVEVCFDDNSVLAASNVVPEGQFDGADYDLSSGWW